MITKYHLIAFLLDNGVSREDAKAIANRIHDAADAAGGRPFEIALVKYRNELTRFRDRLHSFITSYDIDEYNLFEEPATAPNVTIPAPVQS